MASGRAGKARFLLVLLVALSLADAPRLVQLALGLEEPDCQGDCAHSLDSEGCPPGCTTGRCAKIAASVVVVTTTVRELPALPEEKPAREQAVPGGPGGERLFRPPRA